MSEDPEHGIEGADPVPVDEAAAASDSDSEDSDSEDGNLCGESPGGDRNDNSREGPGPDARPGLIEQC